MIKFISIFFVFAFFTNLHIASAQDFEKKDISPEEKYSIAEGYIYDENYEKALEYFLEILTEEPENANINFKIGYCYLNTVLDKHKAIDYLEKAVLNVSENADLGDYLEKSAPLEAHFFLGKAYHINYQFDQAIDTLNYLKTLFSQKDYPDFFKKINRQIQMCENGKELVKNSRDIVVTNLGNGINTEYAEHSPVFSADESVLIITSKRKGNLNSIKTLDGQYDENIYISYNNNGVWTEPVSIGENINTPKHEATIGLSVDGQHLFIYKDDDGDGNIYYSQLEGNEWTKPIKFGPSINTKNRETHASLSANGKTIYFTSDKKGGYGGMDIYYVNILPNGEWGPAYNLGPQINTPYNEEGPYLHPDGVTLFFSSQGHKTMGGYDIFYSTLFNQTEWSEPINIGYPINTTEDDVFYLPTADGNRAYYASHTTGGLGESDIFMITLTGEKEKNLTVMSGKIKIKPGQPINGTITVTDATNDELAGIYTPNSKTGKYLFILQPGKKYKISYEIEGYGIKNDELYVSENSAYNEIKKVINLDTPDFVQEVQAQDTTESKEETKPETEPDTKSDTKSLIEKYRELTVPTNILFDFDKDIPIKKYPSLDTLANYLIANPNAIIEIGGHTDSQGEDIYNIHLSLRRAIYVKNYLINRGVKKESLLAKGYGEKKPIAINKNPDGSFNEDSQIYNRRIEFEVIKQGKTKLFIKNIDVPDKYKNK